MTAALDIDTGFARLFGAGRTTGHDHPQPPTVTDEASFHTAIAALLTTPALAASAGGRQVRAQAAQHIASRYAAEPAGLIAQTLFDRLDATSDYVSSVIDYVADWHVEDALRRAIAPDQMLQDSAGVIAESLAVRLTARVRQARPDQHPPALPALLPDCDIIRWADERSEGAHREIHGSGPALLSEDQWLSATRWALNAPTIASAENRLQYATTGLWGEGAAPYRRRSAADADPTLQV